MIIKISCGWCSSKEVSFHHTGYDEFICKDCIDRVKEEDRKEYEEQRDYHETYLQETIRRNS